MQLKLFSDQFLYQQVDAKTLDRYFNRLPTKAKKFSDEFYLIRLLSHHMLEPIVMPLQAAIENADPKDEVAQIVYNPPTPSLGPAIFEIERGLETHWIALARYQWEYQLYITRLRTALKQYTPLVPTPIYYVILASTSGFPNITLLDASFEDIAKANVIPILPKELHPSLENVMEFIDEAIQKFGFDSEQSSALYAENLQYSLLHGRFLTHYQIMEISKQLAD